MKKSVIDVIKKIQIIIIAVFFISCQSNSDDYAGDPFSDNKYQGGAQVIPGKIECEYYDFGGEGIAFHDVDTINSGSGGLNPADGSYLHEFRTSEAVDISYTKFRDPAMDNSIFNKVDPEKDQLYVGWTEPGEWMKYSVNVNTSGDYQVGIMYTANKKGKISIAFNDVKTEPLDIPSTYVEADTLEWRQWHHWNRIDSLTTIHLPRGGNVLTLKTEDVGNMNYDYLMFRLID